MKNLILQINQFLGDYQFLLAAEILALFLKSYVLVSITVWGLRSSKIQRTWIYFVSMIIGSIVIDFGWVIKLIELLFIAKMDYRVQIFFIRFAWIFAIVQYQSLALFIENLIERKSRLNIRQKIFLSISSSIALIFLYLTIFKTHSTFSIQDRPEIEFLILKYATYYLFLLVLPSIFIASYKLFKSELPKILKKQLKILILGLICPWIILDFIQVYPFNIIPGYIASNYAVVTISTLLIAFAAFYTTKKLMLLRLFNFIAHVQSKKKYNFINNFKDILEQLGQSTSLNELIHITKTFFKDSLHISTGRTSLYIRKLDSAKNNDAQIIQNGDNANKIHEAKIEIIENFINSIDNSETNNLLKQSKVLIYDEIDFSNFYEENDTRTNILKFLNQINADVFIPIYKKNTIIASIIVERDIRSNELYTNLERDEMVVFSSYLSNIINLLQNRNLESIIQQEKELKEELYHKHQEIDQYKESIRSFLKKSQYKKIGILFYKNRKFIYGNQDAKEIIPININSQEGHSLSKDLRQVAKQVEDYKSSQTVYSKDPNGNRLVLTGIPNLESNNVIITVFYPDISDVIKQQLDFLKDPSKWDYLLYLETTRSGQLIDQLIPGSGESLLNFKINLLKIALTKKAILLEMPEEDLAPTVEIIHHISLRENLHILKLQSFSKNFDVAIKLFGINPIFGKMENKPLLQKLDGTGTLFIQNIHFLDPETQGYLADFIKYNFFKIFKSDQKIVSDVRIICSTNLNLNNLVQEGKFSKSLYDELRKTSLSMPSLLTLSEEELKNLAQGFSDQAIQTNEFKNLLEFTDKEKINLINKRPVSLQEFKTKVQQILTEKSKKNHVFQETQFDPAYNITDPKLIEAARLGKHALKDPKLVALLWDKFKNQNKIATFLGVNRSSVHRRCKEYNIE